MLARVVGESGEELDGEGGSGGGGGGMMCVVRGGATREGWRCVDGHGSSRHDLAARTSRRHRREET